MTSLETCRALILFKQGLGSDLYLQSWMARLGTKFVFSSIDRKDKTMWRLYLLPRTEGKDDEEMKLRITQS